MKEFLSVDLLRRLEGKAKELGLDERLLIENASSNLFNVIDSLDLGKKVVVVSGKGNNGADVLSCARKLSSRGYCVEVIILGDKELGDEAKIQRDILEKIKVPICYIKDDNIKSVSNFFQNSDFILEGILGIGLRGKVSSFIKIIIHLINSSNKAIVSCDIPSGLSPDEGSALGAVVKASHTVTFIANKKGFSSKYAKIVCGKVHVVDIGVSTQILKRLLKEEI